MAELPTGTVTFLFTDLEGSTRLWEEHPEAMKLALARHDEILRVAIESHAGHVVKTTGDGFHAVFAVALDAVLAAIDAQLALNGDELGPEGPLRVRMGLHSGTAELRGGDYFGSAVNRAARVMSVAHGGQVICSHATEELVADDWEAGLTTRDLGVHRLRDLASPVRLCQVVHPELLGEFPPPRSLEGAAGNLPLQVTSFVGRGDDVHAVAKALEVSRLVTLTGTGGVGKTRLGIQVAAEVVDRFPDGAWLCELAGAGDAHDALQIVAETLGAAPRVGMSIDATIADALSYKHMLVVLDNCEHVLGAVGRLAEAVLRSCQGVHVLATSREALAVDGEQVWPVRPLAVPERSSDAITIGTAPSARLFVERARAVRPHFEIDDTNAYAVADICDRVDGIPLAIELAAARVLALSPADIATKLDERFRLLRGGRRSAMERQQTLRATVDWSYSLLDARDRVIFERLSVFMGGFDVSAAEVVAADDLIEAWDVVEALASLVGKSMVVADEDPTGGVRYQMLETLRQYALEKLTDRGDAERFYRRHADFFAEFAEHVGPELTGPDELLWRVRYRLELDNLRSAVAWALDSEDDSDGELAVRIVAALATEAVQEGSGGLSSLAERALERARRSTSGRRCAVLGAAAWIALRHRSDFEAAIRLGTEALEQGVDRECPAPQLPYAAIGIALGYGRDFARIRALYEEAKRSLTAVGAPAFAHAFIQSSLAFAEATSPDPSRAPADAEEALRLARALGNPTQLAAALYILALAIWQVDEKRALAALEESIALAWSGAYSGTYAMTRGLFAELQARSGDPTALPSLHGALYDLLSGSGLDLQAGTVMDRGIQVCAALGHYNLAATIGGVTVVGAYAGTSSLPTAELPNRAEALDMCRTELGDDDYRTAFERGATMTRDEVDSWLLETLDRLSREGSAD